ncbi:MAG: glycosyltransferase family 4 protein [Candidatus Dojkabacteria bacterium]
MKNKINQYNLISISHFFYPRVGGLENMAYGLVKNLSDKGFKSIAIFGNDRNLKFESDGFTWKSFNTIKLFKGTYPILGIRFFLFCLNTIKDNPNAVVLLHDRHLTSSIIGALICKFLNRDYIVISHTTVSNYFQNKFFEILSVLFEKLISKMVLNNASHIICVSRSNKDYIIKNFNIDSYKTSVIYNCFKDDSISRFYQKVKSKTVIFNTKLSLVKDPNTAALAFLELARKYTDWKFVIAGEGSSILDEMNDLPLNLEYKPKFLPQLEVFELLGDSSIYINSSLNEGLSLGVIEAASLGNIVVLSDAPGNVEVANNLSCSKYIFERKNYKDLVSKIEMAINDIEHPGFTNLQEKISHLAYLHFSPKSIYNKYSDFISKYKADTIVFKENKQKLKVKIKDYY